MNKTIITIGIIVIVIGLLWPWIVKLPFGRLPGDIAIKKEGFQIFFPVTTMIVVSIVVSLLFWLFKK